jgi:hypothetical protein
MSGLSAPRSIFGIHSASFYSRVDDSWYGELRVLENSSIGLTAEQIKLLGGSNKFDWSSEIGSMTAEMSLSFSEYPDFVFELFGGNAPTANAAETNGDVSTLTNSEGTLVEASTGVASIAAKSGSEADLKFGKYTMKAVSATEVDIYLSSDIDIGRGTNGEYQNDALKITASPLVVPGTGGTVDVPSFGLTITGGSGTVNLTSGDTATFEVRPPNNGSMEVVIGQRSDQNFPEFGAIIMAAKQSTGEMVEIDAYRCKAAGLPLGFARNAYSPAEVTVSLLYDSAKDGVFKMRHIEPTIA